MKGIGIKRKGTPGTRLNMGNKIQEVLMILPMTIGFLLFEVFPEVCRQLDPERHYHLSSPSGGKWANGPSAGDTHGYTHLWFFSGKST